MSRYHSVTNNFASGEFSPRTLGRSDLTEYKNGLQLMKNFLSLRNGGAAKRPGARFIVDLGTMNEPALLPFIASEALGYLVAVDPTAVGLNQFMRIFKADGTEMALSSQLDALDGTISTFPRTLDPRGFIFTQIADFLFFTHNSGKWPPLVLIRLTETSFHLAGYSNFTNPFNTIGIPDTSAILIANILKLPFRDPNISKIELAPSGIGLGSTITLSANSAFFNVGHVGTVIKLNQSGITGAATITVFTSDVLVTAVVINVFNNTAATTNFEEAAWSDFRGWPRSVSAYEQRLDWGGNDFQPDTIWGSLVGNVFHMMARKFEQDQDSPTDVTGLNYFGVNTPQDPFVFAMGAKDVNRISFLASNSNLIVGTLSTEYIGNGGNEILSAESVGFKAQTNYGSQASKVVMVGDETLFISRDGRKLRNFRFSDNNGSNISLDLSFIADHMNRIGGKNYGFVDMAYEKSGDIVWLINKNKRLVSFTYQLDNPTAAWAQHELGGNLGDVIGVTTIPNEDGVADDVFIVVKRTINAVTKFYIETIPEIFDADSLSSVPTVLEDISVYLDSAKVFLVPAGPGTGTITGLDHLDGEVVTVTKDGKFLNTFTVTGNEIDLGETFPTGTRFVTGFPYRADLVLLPAFQGGDLGVAIGSIKRIDTAVIRFFKTFDCTVGTFGSTFNQPINFGTDIFTGLKKIEISGDPERDHAIALFSDKPHPCNVLFITQRGKADE